MNLSLEPGCYVVAVSGGVDSMALLHLLWMRSRQEADWQLTVAHFDHGIRPDSALDRELVQKIAHQYGLPFVYAKGNLGPAASEATARKARYEFLRRSMDETKSRAIITAHHQDDVLETAIINMLRGTSRKGLSALQNQEDVKRPLLSIPKSELEAYARQHKLDWHEDATNQDERYLRNYVRHRILPRFTADDRQRLLGLIQRLGQLNEELDARLHEQLPEQLGLDRGWFNHLPHEVAREVLAAWLREQGIGNFDRKLLERVTVAAKVAHPGKQVDILGTVKLKVGKKHLALTRLER